jgi:hypothetical protein
MNTTGSSQDVTLSRVCKGLNFMTFWIFAKIRAQQPQDTRRNLYNIAVVV